MSAADDDLYSGYNDAGGDAYAVPAAGGIGAPPPGTGAFHAPPGTGQAARPMTSNKVRAGAMGGRETQTHALERPAPCARRPARGGGAGGGRRRVWSGPSGALETSERRAALPRAYARVRARSGA